MRSRAVSASVRPQDPTSAGAPDQPSRVAAGMVMLIRAGSGVLRPVWSSGEPGGGPSNPAGRPPSSSSSSASASSSASSAGGGAASGAVGADDGGVAGDGAAAGAGVAAGVAVVALVGFDGGRGEAVPGAALGDPV